MPTKKKRYNARFPPARIKKIMQNDDEIGKVAAAVPVIISRALELFVESMLKKVDHVTASRGVRTLSPSLIKQCIMSDARFDFLKDLVAGIPDLQGDFDDTTPPQSAGVLTQRSLEGFPPNGSSTLTGFPSNGSSTLSGFPSNGSLPCSISPTAGILTPSTPGSGVGNVFFAQAGKKPVRSFPRQLSTMKPRGRPRKIDGSPLKPEAPKKPKKDPSSTPGCRGRKKKQKEIRFIDDDLSDVDVACFDEKPKSNGNSNGHYLPTIPSTESRVAAAVAVTAPVPVVHYTAPLVQNTAPAPMVQPTVPAPTVQCPKFTNHIPVHLSMASAATMRPSLKRSVSYSVSSTTGYIQRSELLNSNGVTFALTYPMPLSPALPPLTRPQGVGFFNTPSTITSTTTPTSTWAAQNGIDEDYDT